ncbi:GNAT family N-acetyltransferase [Halomonas binhaiensis]|uniref:GNAT family N-acetyltransferase n=2 Tax=Halomonas binhaiensis TaxID=2562282 RepID=A0A5C1NLQ1_9GAMM|nr:GNAT family N-acetyltransferase [Halomonas binhaiensis]QEM84156.1 GNAT family N-acetyltransferase [Halomonas binhaiensis]
MPPPVSRGTGPMARIHYREATSDDAADQAEVFHHAVMQGTSRHYTMAQRQAWASALSRDASVWMDRQSRYRTLVAECDRRCVGFVELDMEKANVEMLYVWPSLAGMGIGRSLLALAECNLREGGAVRMTIDASLGLAEYLMRHGWDSHGVEWVERAGERLPRHNMSKNLS